MEEQQLRGRFPSERFVRFFCANLPIKNENWSGKLHAYKWFASLFSSVQFSSVQFSSVQFSSVQFSSVQFKWRPSPSLPDPPARAIGRARATARAAQLAWLDEWCWHGLLTVVPRVERVRPTSDELWRSGVFGLTRARLGGKLWRLAQRRRRGADRPRVSLEFSDFRRFPRTRSEGLCVLRSCMLSHPYSVLAEA